MSVVIDLHHIASVVFHDQIVGPPFTETPFSSQTVIVTFADGTHQRIHLFPEAGTEFDAVVRFRVFANQERDGGADSVESDAA